MKFIADVMLGRLAKRLRLLGFDVLYNAALTDNDIIRLSFSQNRIILTRDTGLVARPLAANHLLIASELVNEQISQVFAAFSLHEASDALTRCSVCNTALAPLDKRKAKDLVPEYVYKAYDAFLRCATCGRIYWKGSHVKRMLLPGGKQIK